MDAPLNGTAPSLRSFASKSQGRHLFGDGNVIVSVRDACDRPSTRDALHDVLTALPPWYLADLSAGVARALADAGVVGRVGLDFIARLEPAGDWSLHALEINLRKGGTTHPFSGLRNLVAVGDRATGNVVDPAWTGRPVSSVIDAIQSAGLQFDPDLGTGMVLHMLSCLAVEGRFGATAIGRTAEHADELFDMMVAAVRATQP